MNKPQPNEITIGSDELLQQLLDQLQSLAKERDQLRAQLQEMTCDTTRMHALIEQNISLERSARELTAENERLSARLESLSRQFAELVGAFAKDDFVELSPGDHFLASFVERLTDSKPNSPDATMPRPYTVNGDIRINEPLLTVAQTRRMLWEAKNPVAAARSSQATSRPTS